MIGPAGAAQVGALLQQALRAGNPLHSAPGAALLLFAATSAFTDLRDGLNAVWQVRARPGAGWRMLGRARLLAVALVLGLGGVLLASVALDAMVGSGLNWVQARSPRAAAPLGQAIDGLLSWGLTAGFFAVLYRVLPAARLRWRDVAAGAGLAAALFLLGRYGLGHYLHAADPGRAHGGAGAVAGLLVWLYYSSLVLYAGAEFGKCYALRHGGAVRPGRDAEAVQTVPVESTPGKP